jgi:hypothetical protein
VHAETVRTFIQDAAPGATFEPENIDKLKPALNSFGQTLYEVSADGRTLSATETDVTVVEDNLVFRLLYPLTAEGPLRLRAAHLSRVAPEFIAHVSVTDDASTLLTTRPQTEQPARRSRPPVRPRGAR